MFRSNAIGFRGVFGIALGVAAACLVACGGDAQDAAFKRATETLVEVRAAVDEARERVQTKLAELEAVQSEVEEARSSLREAERELAEAQQTVGEFATDDVLFRTVQKNLLEDEHLEDVAIAARVSDGVVRLTGTVPDKKTRNRALEIARSVPGVTEVESLIKVSNTAVSAAEDD